jgi:hypothetical protein
MKRWLVALLMVSTGIVGCGTTGDDSVEGGVYPVPTNRGYAFMDSTGRIIIKPIFDKAEMDTILGLTMVASGEWHGLVDFQGRIVVPATQSSPMTPFLAFQYGLAPFETDSGMGYITRDGVVAIEPEYATAMLFSGGLAAVANMEKKFGYINTSGEVVIPFEYDDTYQYRFGLAGVEINHKWGVIDSTNRMVIDPQYKGASHFGPDVARFRVRGSGWGLVDTTGNVLLEPGCERIEKPVDGLARYSQNHIWGLLNIAGEVVATPQFKTLKLAPSGVSWGQTTDGLWGAMARDGSWIIEPQYESAFLMLGAPVIVKKNGKTGLVRLDGTKILEPMFADIYRFNEGLAAYTADGEQWGLIDTLGQVVVEPRYDRVGPFSEGLAWFNEGGTVLKSGAIEGGRWGYLDHSGSIAITPEKYDRVGPFSSGMAPVKQHNLWGIIDTTGKIVIPIFYDQAEIIRDLVKVKDEDNLGKYWGYMNRYGRWVWHPDQGENYVTPSDGTR